MGWTHKRRRFTSFIKDIMTEYIKYSERNQINDPFLAELFDYLERVAGWEIQDGLKTHSGHTLIISGVLHLYIFEERVVFTVQ